MNVHSSFLLITALKCKQPHCLSMDELIKKRKYEKKNLKYSHKIGYYPEIYKRNKLLIQPTT